MSDTVQYAYWENIEEREFYCPDEKTTITTTTQTCSRCKARTGFVGPKKYIFDAHCPYCGVQMHENTRE